MQYKELEKKLQHVQTQRETDMKETRSRLSAIDDQLQHLQRLDDLEAKALKSMEYHVTTNTALTEVQSQMSEIMGMIRGLADQSHFSLQSAHQSLDINQQGTQSNESIPTNTGTSGSHQDHISHAHLPVATGRLAQEENHGTRSSASSSSGSQHAKPPPKKNLKRCMPDAMEQLTLASEQGEDGGSETTFGSSRTQAPVPMISQQSPLLLPSFPVSSSPNNGIGWHLSGIYCPARSG
jgi:hypothetical protein